MSLKKIIRNTLGSNYHKFRSKYILTKLFGDNYLAVRKYIKSITVKLSFIKKERTFKDILIIQNWEKNGSTCRKIKRQLDP